MMTRREQLALRRSTAGFTLVEMMVAALAGSLTIAAVYSLAAGSSRAFQEQNRVSQAQAAVRSGMEQLRRDLSRAGFASTPDSGANAASGDRGANPAGCAVTSGYRLVGLDVNDRAYSAQLRLPGDTANVVQADGVVMSGNFATGDHYLVSEIQGNGTSISLQQSRQSFRRSFGATVDPQRFEDAFREGRWVYLVSETGRRAARQITAVNGAAATITVSPGIPVSCFGYGRGARISPVSRVEYFAVAPENNAAFDWLLPVGSATEREARGVDQTILARRELAFDGTNTPIANSERVVLEYLVHFDVAVTLNTAAAGAAPNLVETLIGDGGAAALEANPASARAVRVTLGVRTPGVDPNFPWTGPRADQRAPLRSYLPRLPPNTSLTQAVGLAPGAHVRTAEEVIMLENIANRGL